DRAKENHDHGRRENQERYHGTIMMLRLPFEPVISTNAFEPQSRPGLSSSAPISAPIGGA
ncbi:MAG: hypothetical protein ACO3J2_09070, partial [Chthoniobacterales bacterium]